MTSPSELVSINVNEVGIEYHNSLNFVGTVDWGRPGLKITRLRLISDRGFPYWDVSYCHGKLDGKDVRVSLPFSQIPKRDTPAGKRYGFGKSFIVNEGIRDGVYVKATGILNDDVMSWLMG